MSFNFVQNIHKPKQITLIIIVAVLQITNVLDNMARNGKSNVEVLLFPPCLHVESYKCQNPEPHSQHDQHHDISYKIGLKIMRYT